MTVDYNNKELSTIVVRSINVKLYGQNEITYSNHIRYFCMYVLYGKIILFYCGVVVAGHLYCENEMKMTYNRVTICDRISQQLSPEQSQLVEETNLQTIQFPIE